MPEPSSTVRFAADVVISHAGDEAVILRLADETVFALNATAARIAELIVEGLTIHAIVDQIAGEYSRPARDVSVSVHELVNELLTKGLVEHVGDGRPSAR